MSEMKVSPRRRTGRMECPTCAFTWVRTAANADKKICPKCQSPLATGPGARRKPGEASTHKHAPGKAIVNESGSCPKNDGGNGPHVYKFGKCSHCRKAEGKLISKKGAVLNPGASPAQTCKDGGKHTFKFAKCSKCGRSEFAK